MKKYLFLIWAIACKSALWAQNYNCNVHNSDPEYIKLLKNLPHNYSNNGRNVREIAINMILVQYNDGTLITPQDAMQVVEDANVLFANANMHFNLCQISIAPYPYAQFPNLVEGFNDQVESVLEAQYYLPGYLNIYYARNVPQNATLPNSHPLGHQPRIVTSQAGVIILAHELGHFFSLIHTHAQNAYNPVPSTTELVNGSNCATAGDYICDTPADPGLYAFRMAPPPACQYIDTVTTDINGDLYQPIVNNYMSVLSHCTNSFTPEQYSRMSYIAEHHRAYLKTGTMGFTIDSLPLRVCVSDSAVLLSSPNPGGVFSGNGVVGNYFHPGIAGPGHHIISYSMPSNINSSENTDAFFFYTDTLYKTNQAWQTFQVQNDGLLTGFSFGIQNTLGQNVNYTLYNGSGTGGSVLAQGVLNLSANAGWDWLKATFPSVPVVAGDNYTVEFSLIDSAYFISSGNDYYSAGSGNFTGDYNFISYLIPNASLCSNTLQTSILVSAPVSINSDHLAEKYCLNGQVTYPGFEPSGGSIYINGILQDSIAPAILGDGMHSISYIYDNNLGCLSNLTDTFFVQSQVYLNLNDSSIFCQNSDSVMIAASNPDGQLYIDGTEFSGNFLDMSLFAPGYHSLSYALNSQNYNWEIVDQQNYQALNPGAFSMGGSGYYWQSFTADINGYLSEIKLAISSPQPLTATYKLYKGEGIFTLPIYSGTLTFGGQNYFYNRFLFPDSLIYVWQDSVYTFQVNVQGANISTEVKGDYINNYTRGKSNYSTIGIESDFWFKTYVVPDASHCSSDTVNVSFQVLPAFAINLGNDTVLTSFQTLTLGTLIPGASYLWSTGDTVPIIQVNGSSASGDIWLQVINAAGCTATDTIHIDLITQSQNVNSSIKFIVNPNPHNLDFEIKGNYPIQKIYLYDMAGKVVYSHNPEPGSFNHTINTGHLSSGIYTLRVLSNNSPFTYKIAKF